MEYIDKQTWYICPMHPDVVQDTPGMCPECGMNLVSAKQRAKQIAEREGYDKHERIIL